MSIYCQAVHPDGTVLTFDDVLSTGDLVEAHGGPSGHFLVGLDRGDDYPLLHPVGRDEYEAYWNELRRREKQHRDRLIADSVIAPGSQENAVMSGQDELLPGEDLGHFAVAFNPTRARRAEEAAAEADEPERPKARFDGAFSRMTCEACESVFDVEDDVSNGEAVTCDVCGDEREVEGR